MKIFSITLFTCLIFIFLPCIAMCGVTIYGDLSLAKDTGDPYRSLYFSDNSSQQFASPWSFNGLSPNSIFYTAPGGKVGVGTTTPAKELDVTGEVRATGTMTAGGFSTAGSVTAQDLSWSGLATGVMAGVLIGNADSANVASALAGAEYGNAVADGCQVPLALPGSTAPDCSACSTGKCLVVPSGYLDGLSWMRVARYTPQQTGRIDIAVDRAIVCNQAATTSGSFRVDLAVEDESDPFPPPNNPPSRVLGSASYISVQSGVSPSYNYLSVEPLLQGATLVTDQGYVRPRRHYSFFVLVRDTTSGIPTFSGCYFVETDVRLRFTPDSGNVVNISP